MKKLEIVGLAFLASLFAKEVVNAKRVTKAVSSGLLGPVRLEKEMTE